VSNESRELFSPNQRPLDIVSLSRGLPWSSLCTLPPGHIACQVVARNQMPYRHAPRALTQPRARAWLAGNPSGRRVLRDVSPLSRVREYPTQWCIGLCEYPTQWCIGLCEYPTLNQRYRFLATATDNLVGYTPYSRLLAHGAPCTPLVLICCVTNHSPQCVVIIINISWRFVVNVEKGNFQVTLCRVLKVF
jgi:hypothetical protein